MHLIFWKEKNQETLVVYDVAVSDIIFTLVPPQEILD